jgi:hypothetical protein
MTAIPILHHFTHFDMSLRGRLAGSEAVDSVQIKEQKNFLIFVAELIGPFGCRESWCGKRSSSEARSFHLVRTTISFVPILLDAYCPKVVNRQVTASGNFKLFGSEISLCEQFILQ